MAGFTINKINYANVAAGLQTWSFWYKLWNDPESAYTLISNAAQVQTDGNLVAPLNVVGLTAGQLYYLRAANNCTSPVEYFVESINV